MLRTMFAPFLFFCLLNGMGVFISKKSFGKCLPLTMMLSTFIMYISQFVFRTFVIGERMLYGLAFIALVLMILKWKNKDFRNKFVSFGFYAFVAIYAIYLFVDFNRFFTAWDEFSHWGMMVKEMLRIDRFYSEELSNLLTHKDYPPFISLFELLWCNLCGKYSEMAVSMAIHVFTLSLLVPGLFEDLEEKKGAEKFIIAFILTVIYIFIILTFDMYGIFDTIYTDMFMSILYVYTMSLIINKDAIYTGFGYISLLVSVSALIISKQMSIAFVLLVWAYWFIRVISECHSKNTLSLKKIVSMGIVVVIPLISYKMWTEYINSLEIIGQFDLTKISIRTIFAVLSGGGEWIQQSTYRDYVAALFQKSLISGNIVITYISSIFIVLLLLYIIYMINKSVYKKNDIVELGLVFIVGTIGYMVTVFILYMFCFTENEMQNLASYERYMSTYVISEFLIIVYLIIQMSYKQNAYKINGKNLLIVLAISMIVLDSSKLIELTPQCIYGDQAVHFRNYATVLADKTESGSKIFIIADSNGKYQFYINYYVNDRQIYNEYENILFVDFSDEQYKNSVINAICDNDYLFVIETNTNVNNLLAEMNAGKELKKEAVYKILERNDGFVLAEK